MLWSCYDHVRRVKNKFMHYRWQPRQCMAGTYCLSLSLHLAGQNFLFKMLAAAIAGIAGPCNSSTSAPSALIFPGLQIRQSPSQSVWRLVQFVHTPLEFTGCILLLAAASPAFHSSCSVCLVLYTLSNKVTCPKSEAFVFPFLVVLPRSVPVILQGDARAASSAGTGLCPAGSANWGRGGSAFRFPPWWPGPNRVEFLGSRTWNPTWSWRCYSLEIVCGLSCLDSSLPASTHLNSDWHTPSFCPRPCPHALWWSCWPGNTVPLAPPFRKRSAMIL